MLVVREIHEGRLRVAKRVYNHAQLLLVPELLKNFEVVSIDESLSLGLWVFGDVEVGLDEAVVLMACVACILHIDQLIELTSNQHASVAHTAGSPNVEVVPIRSAVGRIFAKQTLFPHFWLLLHV